MKPQYAKCDMRTSFFVNEDDNFTEIANELAALLLSHTKVERVTFHANVGFEFVMSYEEEGTYDQ